MSQMKTTNHLQWVHSFHVSRRWLRWGAACGLVIAQSLVGNAWAAVPKVYAYAIGAIEGTGGRCVRTTPSCTVLFVFDVAEFNDEKPFPVTVKVWESKAEGMFHLPPAPPLDALQQAVLERLKGKRAEYGFTKVYNYEIKIAPQPEDYFFNPRRLESVRSSRDKYLKSELTNRFMMVEYPGPWAGQVPENTSQTRTGEAGGKQTPSGKNNTVSRPTDLSLEAAARSDKGSASANSSSPSSMGNASNTTKHSQSGTEGAVAPVSPAVIKDPVARRASARHAAEEMPEPKHERTERLELLMVSSDESWACAWGSAYIESDEGVAPGGRRVHEVIQNFGCRCSDTTWKGKPAKSCLTSYSRAVTARGPLKKRAGFHGGYGMYFALPSDHRDRNALDEQLEQAWRDVGGAGPMPSYVHPRNIDW